ncbi:MAG TPA: hypothetical protein VLD83_14895 [Candidatus Binatia bacterium]|nr:hypothetical protein [Candidatus Binatia bacterium]
MALLSHRLHHAVGLLGIGRLAFVALAVTPVAGRMVMIVGVRMSFCCRSRQFFKEMMNPMGRRGREKKNK